MSRLYLIACVIACVFFVFLYGLNSGKYKCEQRHLVAEINTIQKSEKNFMKTKKDIHDKVYKTTGGDIRRILFDKYTIGE